MLLSLYCRFKCVADSALENKKGGAYSQEVDDILHRKAHAIINCYLNSPVPPKIQVNSLNIDLYKIKLIFLDQLSTGCGSVCFRSNWSRAIHPGIIP